MSDQESRTPRVFLVRHGETEWAKNGRYTGITDIDLTAEGVAQVSSTAESLVGVDKLVNPARLTAIYVSPRKRAIRTLELLLPSKVGRPEATITECIRERDYGDYEGRTTNQIQELRKAKGLDTDRPWNIWRDGCEGGESMQQVTERLDKIISQIREIQSPHMDGKKPVDILLVAHGLILRCFLKRWLGFPVDFDLPMIFAPGAIAVLSYKENDIKKPTFHLGVALPPTVSRPSGLAQWTGWLIVAGGLCGSLCLQWYRKSRR